MKILQWNARSLIANGQELKRFVYQLAVLPDITCIQETWLRPQLNFCIPGYKLVRKDRVGTNGGGCGTFVKDGVTYREIIIDVLGECIAVEVWTQGGGLKVVNFYNPCNQLTLDDQHIIRIKAGENLIWCGDFNAHNSLWGSTCTDNNGCVVEEFMEEYALVCLNNGKGTRFNIRDSSMSCIDLTIVSGTIALECKWEVLEQSTLGSDHFPILCNVGLEIYQQNKTMPNRWRFDKANWDKFNRLCIDGMVNYSLDDDIDLCSDRLITIIINAAKESIPKSEGKVRLKIVPWWNDECTKAVKDRNKAFRELNKTLIPITLSEETGSGKEDN